MISVVGFKGIAWHFKLAEQFFVSMKVLSWAVLWTLTRALSADTAHCSMAAPCNQAPLNCSPCWAPWLGTNNWQPGSSPRDKAPVPWKGATKIFWKRIQQPPHVWFTQGLCHSPLAQPPSCACCQQGLVRSPLPSTFLPTACGCQLPQALCLQLTSSWLFSFAHICWHKWMISPDRCLLTILGQVATSPQEKMPNRLSINFKRAMIRLRKEQHKKLTSLQHQKVI